MYILIIEKKKIYFDWSNIFRVMKLLLFASVIMGIAIAAAFSMYGKFVEPVSFINNGIRMAFSACAGIAVFVLIARKLKIEGLEVVLNIIKIFK